MALLVLGRKVVYRGAQCEIWHAGTALLVDPALLLRGAWVLLGALRLKLVVCGHEGLLISERQVRFPDFCKALFAFSCVVRIWVVLQLHRVLGLLRRGLAIELTGAHI